MNFDEKYPNTELRSLSWKQPFASLMLHGKIETRVWDTKYRGWVLICASKKAYYRDDCMVIAGEDQYSRIYDELNESRGVDGLYKTFGQAIAIGKLIDSRPMTPYDSDKCFVEYISPWVSISKKTGMGTEKQLWCHVYEDVQYIEPIPWKGSQGWTNVHDDIKSLIHIK